PPAGAWDLATRQALTGDRWPALKRELEVGYDFVVVDSGPVLPVSDSLLLARDADGVLLSVLLDVSRVASIAETRNRLQSVDANVLGVVVNGVVTPAYRAAQSRAVPTVVGAAITAAEVSRHLGLDSDSARRPTNNLDIGIRVNERGDQFGTGTA